MTERHSWAAAWDDTEQNGGGIRYRRLVEEAPEALMVLGQDLVVRYASPAVGRLLGLDPANLALEAEEGFSVDDASHLVPTAEKLRALVVRLVVDDFGHGRSSLSYLDRYPVDLLKIGHSFVARLGQEEDGAAKLVGAIIGFARAMGIRTVAAGVETAEQTASLHEMGCEQAQGFYFFEPAPAAAATKLLDSNRGVA